jgi:hypothetical protein
MYKLNEDKLIKYIKENIEEHFFDFSDVDTEPKITIYAKGDRLFTFSCRLEQYFLEVSGIQYSAERQTFKINKELYRKIMDFCLTRKNIKNMIDKGLSQFIDKLCEKPKDLVGKL